MNIIGKPQGVAVPEVRLMIGGADIPATNFNCNFIAGQIAIARCGILPQYVKSVPTPGENAEAKVIISDKNGGGGGTLFTGYVSGISGRRNGMSFTAGVDLIHKARDLDNMRFGAPGLHPDGANDFSYKILPGTSSSASATSSIWKSGGSYYKGGVIPTDVISEIVKRLQLIGAVQKGRGIYAKSESMGPCISLLQSIKIKCSPPVEVTKTLINDINDSFVGQCENSYNSQVSIWDMLTVLFGELGILFFCMPDGSVVCTPDTSGVKAPGSNIITGDQMLGFDHSSRSYRNIGGVDIICSQPAGVGKNSVSKMDNTTVASYYPSEGRNGASFVVNAPRFMYSLTKISESEGGMTDQAEPPSSGNPNGTKNSSTAGSSEAADAKKFKEGYAKMIYFLERNKTNTFTCVTPVMIGAFPGTTVQLQPYSAARIRPGGGELNDKTIFNGYCYGVSHSIDFKAKNLSTTLQFRNVAPLKEVLSSTHPLYAGWTPLSWA